MRKLMFVLLAMCILQYAKAQKAWSVYTELLGSAEIYSINGNYRFLKSPNIGVRLGVMYVKDFDPRVLTIHHLNYIFGSCHAVEFGIGVKTNFRFRPSFVKGSIVPSGAIMYRHQSDSGWLFRVGITPTLTGLKHKSNAFNIRPLHYLYPGIGFGYSFGARIHD